MVPISLFNFTAMLLCKNTRLSQSQGEEEAHSSGRISVDESIQKKPYSVPTPHTTCFRNSHPSGYCHCIPCVQRDTEQSTDHTEQQAWYRNQLTHSATSANFTMCHHHATDSKAGYTFQRTCLTIKAYSMSLQWTIWTGKERH